jgi:hypothetical protein
VKRAVSVVELRSHDSSCDHSGESKVNFLVGGRLIKWSNVRECPRLVTASSDDFLNVTLKRKILDECYNQ